MFPLVPHGLCMLHIRDSQMLLTFVICVIKMVAVVHMQHIFRKLVFL